METTRSTSHDTGYAAPLDSPPPAFRPPKDWKAWAFWRVAGIYRMLPIGMRRLIEGVMTRVAPTVPESVGSIFRDADYRHAFAGGFIVTFLLCFVVTAFWSALAGTWSGVDPSRVYFSRDATNLINFTFVCPLYVGFGCALMSVCVRGWSELWELAGAPTRSESKAPRWQLRSLSLSSIALIVLLAASLLTANYIKEVLNPAVYSRASWYVDGIASNGERHIGAFGVYYAVLIFWLLAFSLFAFAFVITGFMAGIRIGDAIEAQRLEATTIAELRIRLTTFTRVYILTKLLAATYMFNAITWKWEHPVHSVNFFLLGALLTVAGVYLISVPRYYIELQWHQAKARMADPSPTLLDEYDDIRGWAIRNIAALVDTLIIGGFVWSFWS